MSARLLYSLSDETQDLHTQFGCMNRIFQVFCRQSLTGPKIPGLIHYSLPTGPRDNLRPERTSSMHKTVKGDLKNSTKEKHRVSTDSSSRPSFSSSPRSSNFSLAEILFSKPNVFSQRDFHQDPHSKYSDSMKHLSQLPNSANYSVAKESYQGGPTPKLNPLRSSKETKPTSGWKSFLKSKDLMRLSLDRRENSPSNVRMERYRSQGRSTPSIVAKLMGMEVPTDSTQQDSNQTVQVKSSQDFHKSYVSRSAVNTEDLKKIWVCDSPRLSIGEAASPRSRTANSTKKTSAASRFPDGAEDQNSSFSVYGEIQKRFAKLELKKSGKDLRALKQILDAREKTQKKSPTRKVYALGSASMVEPNKPANYRPSEKLHDSASARNLNDGSSILHRIRTGETSILRLTDMAEYERAMERTTSSGLLRSNQSNGDMTKYGRSPNSSNPRLQREKIGLNKQSSKIQRQQTKLVSSNKNPRRESSILNSNQRDLNLEISAWSLRYISNIIPTPGSDAEATNRYRVDGNKDNYEHTPKLKNWESRFSRQGKILKPSPVYRVQEEVAVGYEEAKWMNWETNDEPSIAMPCDSRNPDQIYISEILSASEILGDPELSIRNTQLQQSLLPINEDNFFVLERRNRGDIIRRKLVFDTANNSKCSFDDDEEMISEDLRHQGLSTSDFQTELPKLAVNIETSIFKDLIFEAVTGLVTLRRRRKELIN